MANRGIIIGGGIGGLTAAIAFLRRDIEVVVCERSPAIREVGAGLTLWLNALRVLDALKMGNTVRERGCVPRIGGVVTWQGRPLAGGLDILKKKFGEVGVAIHRAELQNALFGTLPEGTVKLGKECVGFQQNERAVVAKFKDGSEIEGEFLIGSDGINSAVRAQILGAQRPHYAGYSAWRGTVDGHAEIERVTESWGPGHRFGIVPLKGSVYWFATENAPERAAVPGETNKPRLLELFGKWHAPIPQLVAATDESRILRSDVYDRDPVDNWTNGRVTLLGDAAHATTPSLGQGACLAIEDAFVLARSIAQERNNISNALKNYQSQRIPRTSGIVLESRKLGHICQWENPVACWFRNLLVSCTPSSMNAGRIEKIIDFTA